MWEHRCGKVCASVNQLEIMPQPADERTAQNPWPEYPRTLKTDYGQQEAIAVQGKDPAQLYGEHTA